MFEGALVESRGQLGSPAVRWTAAGSLVVQGALAVGLVALPLLRPESLHMLAKAPELIAPLVTRPVPLVHVRPAEVAASAAAAVPSIPTARIESDIRQIRPLLPDAPGHDDPRPITTGTMVTMGGTGADPLGMGRIGSGTGATPNVTRAAPAGPVHISSGVSAGLLLSAIRPEYPAIAKAARVEGTVVVEAVISRAGRIESARAVSGPEMLRRAALDAVATARYQPFQLNGQAVEVQTTVTVNFKLGS